MADFNFVFKKIIANEGVYGNDPADKGGETCFGISRKFNPDWEGWARVDAKKINGRPQGLTADKELEKMVFDFYKANFWNKISGDAFASNEVACSIADFAVNVGVPRAARIVQSVVGTVMDGRIGNKTIQAIESMQERTFLDLFCEAKGDYYRLITKNRPRNEKFLNGWLNRAERMRFIN